MIEYVLIVLLAAAVYMDFHRHVIPNELIYIGSTACILARVSCCETMSLAGGFVQMTVLLVCLFPLYLIKAVGAGDVKLFMMIGWYWPKENLFKCVFAALLFGAVLGSIKIIHKGRVSKKRVSDAGGENTLPANKIHFALPIFLSVLLKSAGMY